MNDDTSPEALDLAAEYLTAAAAGMVAAAEDQRFETSCRADGLLAPEPVPLDVAFDGRSAGRGRSPKPRRKPEAEVVQEGINFIRSLPDGYARKVHGGAMGNAGEPDVDAVVRGRSCKFEAKAGSQEPSAIQVAAMRRWAKVGALVGWFRTTAELRQLLDHVDDWGHVTDLSAPGCSQPCHQEASP